MKTNLIRRCLVTACLFFSMAASAQTKASDIEQHLTENARTWTWYQDVSPLIDASTLTTNYNKMVFYPTYTVTITTATGKSMSAAWKLIQSPTKTGVTNTLTIGTATYNLTFGTDAQHPDIMMLKGIKPLTDFTSYYNGLMMR